MKTRSCVFVVLLILSVVCSAAAQNGAGAGGGKEFLGTWSGTWEGAGSGGFELSLEAGKDGGAPGGQVSVTGDNTYKATLKTLAFEGNKMSASYAFPPDDRMEIVLTATFDGGTAKGTWAARDKGGSEMAAGTWTVTKK